WAFFASAAILVLALFNQWPRTLTDLVFIMIVSPAIVYFCRGVTLRGAVQVFANRAGRVSYPLYLIHWPLLQFYLFAIKSLSLRGGEAGVMDLGFFLAVLGIASVVTFWIEEPILRRLNQTREASVQGAQTAP
ncbi:MAG: hypothetical protein JO303_17450, partial [Caulobacteraceae bacterium]|nr:hypothetical protein [Caulobacteraceae bacterium]